VHLDEIACPRMNANLCRRQLEDKPSAASVDRAQAENILKKRAIGDRVFTVEHEMHAIDHAESVAPPTESEGAFPTRIDRDFCQVLHSESGGVDD